MKLPILLPVWTSHCWHLLSSFHSQPLERQSVARRRRKIAHCQNLIRLVCNYCSRDGFRCHLPGQPIPSQIEIQMRYCSNHVFKLAGWQNGGSCYSSLCTGSHNVVVFRVRLLVAECWNSKVQHSSSMFVTISISKFISRYLVVDNWLYSKMGRCERIRCCQNQRQHCWHRYSILKYAPFFLRWFFYRNSTVCS